ncbi:DivIVA domain-containing protein [Kribbella amoyensis]|uniref:Cell wall synthesis protein Wag31 n=1 Tax=Kribbella amoyensis TaxID=996641 RepID=A0A561BQT9_9ACTN|nr:DivIVA domain-containing protein [Kribbella amoyensis]TWD81221.1 DivIVA domain-containing protein [Kribbella amoyensis]
MTKSKRRHDSPRYQTPASIREETFQRRMRGLDADQVHDYLDLLADQMQATEKMLDETRAENTRLQTEVQRGQAEVQRGQAELKRVQAELEDYEQAGDRVNEQIVQLFSQAQLVAEEMVQDVSRDARERIDHARAHERQIVAEAMETAGQHVRSYAQSAQAQMQSIVDSFATEVDRIGGASQAGPSQAGASLAGGSGAPAPNREGLDDLGNWKKPFPNGSGPRHSGSA